MHGSVDPPPSYLCSLLTPLAVDRRNKVANMVFIESPCGVGFSFADDKEEALRPSDASTAKDNYALIQAFFDRFPEYRSNVLYLSSESYGGDNYPHHRYREISLSCILHMSQSCPFPVLVLSLPCPGNHSSDLFCGLGHYLPTLAKEIVDQNAQAAETGQTVLKLKGFAVGMFSSSIHTDRC